MADFDPLDEADAGLDHQLRTTLWTLADHARYAELPAPAAEIRTRGDRRRRRRIAGTAALALAAAVVAVSAVTADMTGVRLTTAPPAQPGPVVSLPTSSVKDADLTPDPAHDVGYLIAAQSHNGQLVLIFDRVIWLTGRAATKANHGVPPPDDYLIVNNNPKLRTFTVQPDATLLGSVQLGTPEADGGVGAETSITGQQLIDRTLTQIEHNHQGALVTLAHTGGAEGPVTRLQEITVP